MAFGHILIGAKLHNYLRLGSGLSWPLWLTFVGYAGRRTLGGKVSLADLLSLPAHARGSTASNSSRCDFWKATVAMNICLPHPNVLSSDALLTLNIVNHEIYTAYIPTICSKPLLAAERQYEDSSTTSHIPLC
jgi:hypothetical protein